MSAGYKAVLWNRQKRLYDLTLVGGIVTYLALFIGISAATHPQGTVETFIIRGFGTLALLLLHVVLSIGPLARLDRRFLPLLYNRRHLGVTMFLCALVHGAFSTIQFHSLGNVNPIVSILTSNTNVGSIAEFPFQPLGLGALLILFLMAVTSHDFWLVNLTAPIWKALHMGVYVAYGLLIGHVALGVLQAETHPWLTAALGLGFVWIVGLQVVAGSRERPLDQDVDLPTEQGWVKACAVADIAEDRARIVPVAGERVAIFKYDGKVSAVSNVCQHQNGPLGEGKVIDGCITCPWHGYQYVPETGASPPPFTEKIPTFNVRIVDGDVWIDPTPNAPGTHTEPAPIATGDA